MCIRDRGVGGMTTILDVKINMYPTHAASKPVAIIPNCAATRHAHFVLDGSGPVYLDPPHLSDWPQINWHPDVEKSVRVNLDTPVSYTHLHFTGHCHNRCYHISNCQCWSFILFFVVFFIG